MELKNTSFSGEAVAQGCSLKNVFLEISQSSQENTCAFKAFVKHHKDAPQRSVKIKIQLKFISIQLSEMHGKACNFVKKETLAQVFSCELCEISKNTFLHRAPLVAASVNSSLDRVADLLQ